MYFSEVFDKIRMEETLGYYRSSRNDGKLLGVLHRVSHIVVCTPFQGRTISALSEHQKRNFLIIIYLHIQDQQHIVIPHSRSIDNVDHIPTDPASQKSSKNTLPEPALIPDYKPLNIDDFTDGISNLLPYITSHHSLENFLPIFL